MKLITCGTILHNEKYFLIGHSTNNIFWDIPKGQLNKNEIIPNCALRELKEETNFEGQLEDLKLINFYPNYNKHKILYLFHIYLKILPDLNIFHCNSLIDNSIQPEIDNFMYITIEESCNYLTYNLNKIISQLKFIRDDCVERNFYI